jgi:hypothetical protein
VARGNSCFSILFSLLLRFSPPPPGDPEKREERKENAAGSALDLLVLGVGLADHPHLSLAADDLAAPADLLDACLDLHDSFPLAGEPP